MLPCSQSMSTQSTPVLASVRLILLPGNICQHPVEGPFPSFKAVSSRLAACMVDGMVDVVEVEVVGEMGLVILREVVDACLQDEARASRRTERASDFCIKSSQHPKCLSPPLLTIYSSDVAARGDGSLVSESPGFPTLLRWRDGY